jgi:hypothetical protein
MNQTGLVTRIQAHRQASEAEAEQRRTHETRWGTRSALRILGSRGHAPGRPTDPSRPLLRGGG